MGDGGGDMRYFGVICDEVICDEVICYEVVCDTLGSR